MTEPSSTLRSISRLILAFFSSSLFASATARASATLLFLSASSAAIASKDLSLSALPFREGGEEREASGALRTDLRPDCETSTPC